MFLTGTFTRTLDDKLRFNVPKAIRESLEAASAATGSRPAGLYLAPGTDGSLALYTEQAFGRLAERLGQNSPTGNDVRAFSRLFYAQAQRVDLDGQGRVRISTELAQLADLEKEVVLVGAGDRLEIWDRLRWADYLSQKQPRYDEIAERALGAGVEPPPPSTRSQSSVRAPLHPTYPDEANDQQLPDGQHPPERDQHPRTPARPRPR